MELAAKYCQRLFMEKNVNITTKKNIFAGYTKTDQKYAMLDIMQAKKLQSCFVINYVKYV